MTESLPMLAHRIGSVSYLVRSRATGEEHTESADPATLDAECIRVSAPRTVSGWCNYQNTKPGPRGAFTYHPIPE